MSVKHGAYCHSQMRQFDRLRRAHPAPTADIHPDTAAGRNIADGAWLVLTTARGRIAAKARLNAALAPNVVCASYGWHETMQPELMMDLPPEISLNFETVIDPAACDPISGSDALKGIGCDAQPLSVARSHSQDTRR